MKFKRFVVLASFLFVCSARAVDSVVVFNEINYHPAVNEAASEWVELHNQMAIDIDLSAWHIEDGINYTFAEGTIIPGGGYLVLAANPGALQAATGLTNVKGPFVGSLNNSGERLELRDRNDRLMDTVIYADGGKWPIAADGSGATLAKRDQNKISGVPGNWTSSVAVGGTPGGRNFPETEATVRPLIALDSVWRFDTTGSDLGAAWKEPAFDDSAWAGQSAATLLSYWPFDGNAMATRGTNGVFTGAVTSAADRNGTDGTALAFSGVSQFVNVAGGGGLNGATAGTISMWAKWNTGTQDADCCGSFGAILSRQGDGLFSDNILALSTSNAATAKLVWRQSGGPAPILITSTSVVGTGWRHVVVTFSATGSTLYLDGVAQGSASAGALNANASVPLAIGAWAAGGGGFMNGTLDDVAIWDQPLTPAQIAELAASTKTPLNFLGSENAVYFSGDGTLTSNDSLRKTQLPLGPVTHYFRRAFTFPDNPVRTSLKLDLAVDDGAVVYLNGSEVHRHNMPTGIIAHTTPALAAVDATPILTGIILPTAGLVAGNNLLAVEVHQAATADPGMVFGAGLSAVITPPGLDSLIPDNLVFNEISAAGDGPLQVELINRGSSALDMAGFIIRRTGISPDAAFPLPSQILTAGAYQMVDEATLGFGAMTGDKLFLVRPGGLAVADALEVRSRRRARSPDGTGEFLVPSAATMGTANTFSISHAIVINEIMYGAPPTLEQPAADGNPAVPYSKNPEQWIELHNRSSLTVDLTGWRLDEGIDFPFPTGTTIAAGAYLVVAKNPALLQAKFPGLVALGPYNNSLSGSGEQLMLRDANDNPADTLHYYDDGRWPEAADGGGSSLELRDPRADNAAGENWAASNESSRSVWKTYTYEGIAAASSVGPDTQWREFVLGLLDKGEVLLDDISVVENPATDNVQMLQNTAFTPDAATWRIIGNHSGTVIDDPDQPDNKVLRLVSTGSTDHMSNHAETTFVAATPPATGRRSVVNGRTYRISYRAKWIHGCRQLNTRLYFNRLPRTTVLDGRDRFGTPRTVNTAFSPNIGPTYSNLRHEPTVPAALAPVTISLTATDPDSITAMTLWSRPNGGEWTSQPMTGNGSRYSAILEGRAAAAIVQFYIEGTDAQNIKSTFPAAGPDSRALYKVNDGLAATNGLHNVRLINLTADSNFMHLNINVMSNQRIGTTMIYDEREVFYDVGLRLKGSEHSRTTSLRLGFNIGFNSDQLFRGIHRSVALDRSESVGFGQREMLMNQVLNHSGGVTTKYHDLVKIMAPKAEHTGAAELQLGRYTDVFLNDQYPSGGDGMLFEYELVYQLNSTNNGNVEGIKVPAPDSVVGIGIGPLGNLGVRSNDKESYRWTFLIKNNEDRDDYSRVIPFCKWMATTGTNFTSQLTTYLDVDQWLRGTAINVLSGAGDSYGGDGSMHNVQFYLRPSDGRMLFFPHDMDAFYDASRTITPNGDLSKIIAVPTYARAYYSHLLEIMETTYNSTYMTRWANHFGALLPGQPFASHLAFITQRKNVVTSAVNGAVPTATLFAVTTNGGNDTTAPNSPVTLTGTANLTVKTIMVNGITYPITWTSRTAWSVSVPLASGANALSIQGVDRHGIPLGTALDTITVVNEGEGAPQPVKINEWMANNAGPGGLADPVDGQFQDWIELYNANLTPVDLSGYTLTDTLSQPSKWTFPVGTSISAQGFLLIWADNQTSQNTPDNGLHAAFQLGSGGEAIGLYNAAGVAQHTVNFGAQTENVSEGLFPNGNISSINSMPNWTPRYPNTLAGPFAILTSTVTAAGATITWTSIPGRIYRVEYSDTLTNPWSTLTPDVTATAETTSATETNGTTRRRFYRVRRLE